MPTTTAPDVEETVRRRGADPVELSRAICDEPELAFAEHGSCCAEAQAVVAERGFGVTSAAGGLDTALRADYCSGPLAVGVCAECDAPPGTALASAEVVAPGQQVHGIVTGGAHDRFLAGVVATGCEYSVEQFELRYAARKPEPRSAATVRAEMTRRGRVSMGVARTVVRFAESLDGRDRELAAHEWRAAS
jgi:hypothetical protein